MSTNPRKIHHSLKPFSTCMIFTLILYLLLHYFIVSRFNGGSDTLILPPTQKDYYLTFYVRWWRLWFIIVLLFLDCSMLWNKNLFLCLIKLSSKWFCAISITHYWKYWESRFVKGFTVISKILLANELALGTIKRVMVAVGLLFKRTLLSQAAVGVVLIRCCFFSNYN